MGAGGTVVRVGAGEEKSVMMFCSILKDLF